MRISGKKIIVIGGGIGGLAAALALSRLGAAVTVLEQAAEISDMGAGLQISPNGFAVLDALGLRDAVIDRIASVGAVTLRADETVQYTQIGFRGMGNLEHVEIKQFRTACKIRCSRSAVAVHLAFIAVSAAFRISVWRTHNDIFQ